MAFSISPTLCTFLFLHLLITVQLRACYGARKLTSLYEPPSMALTYHDGGLLHGTLPVTILWYGNFSSSQKSVVSDFFLSLNLPGSETTTTPPVSRWWQTLETYVKMAGKDGVRLVLSGQVHDDGCSMGKALKRTQISELAHRVTGSTAGVLALVLTAEDVAVEGFCMSGCGFHGSDQERKSAFIWVGNSVTQCPGQCAWPFHQPIYGPQGEPLGAPNGVVGVDGMVVNIASLLAGTVTNPFGKGYFQGPAEAPLEAASACPGVYGKGAYPGYAGELLVDTTTGSSYNAMGVNGRKYLLPAFVDPNTKQCWTIV